MNFQWKGRQLWIQLNCRRRIDWKANLNGVTKLGVCVLFEKSNHTYNTFGYEIKYLKKKEADNFTNLDNIIEFPTSSFLSVSIRKTALSKENFTHPKEKCRKRDSFSRCQPVNVFFFPTVSFTNFSSNRYIQRFITEAFVKWFLFNLLFWMYT